MQRIHALRALCEDAFHASDYARLFAEKLCFSVGLSNVIEATPLGSVASLNDRAVKLSFTGNRAA
jgi:hypothetical protein